MPPKKKALPIAPEAAVDHIVESEGTFARYFTMLPHLMDDDTRLDPYAFRLLVRYMRVCGQQNRPCRQGVRRLSRDLGISYAKLSESRKLLESLGYIRCHPVGQNIFITIIDKMRENVEKYDPKTVRDMNALSPRGRPKIVQEIEKTVRPVEQKKNSSLNQKQKPLPPDGGEGKKGKDLALPDVAVKPLTPLQTMVRKIVRCMLDPVRRIPDEQLERFLKGDLEIPGLFKPASSDFSFWNKVAKQLIEKGVNPEQVWMIYRYCVTQDFNGFTAQALVKHADAALMAEKSRASAVRTPSRVDTPGERTNE